MSENQDYDSKQQLTPDQEKIKKIFMLSFMHAQGGPKLQEEILKYVGRRMSHITVPREMPEYAVPKMPVHHMNLGGVIGDTKSDEERAKKKREAEEAISIGNWISFYEGVGKPVEKNMELGALEGITKLLVKRDTHYAELGRSGRQQSGKTDSSQDPYASFFRNYVIFKKPSGDELYDEMYNGVREAHKELIVKDSEYQKDFEVLVSTWETRHPGEKFLPERQEGNEAS